MECKTTIRNFLFRFYLLICVVGLAHKGGAQQTISGAFCPLLCNESFAIPTVNAGSNKFVNCYKTPGICWKTTAPDSMIEFWSSGFLGVPSHSGAQFVELNASYVSTLYQTFPVSLSNSTVTVGFAHRGRSGVDVMKVSIGLNGGPYTALGSFSDGNTAWGTYTVSYVITSPGTYRINFESVSSASGIQSIGNFLDDISVNYSIPNMLSSVMSNSLVCSATGTGNGSVTISPSGGTAPYTYSWTPNVSTSNVATGLGGGTYNYTATIKDAAGCFQTATYTFSPAPSFSITSTQQNILCKGASTGSANVSLSGGKPSYTYTWSPTSGNTPSITGVPAGTYVFKATDAMGCPVTKTITLTEPTSSLSATTSFTNNTRCVTPNGSASITVSGGIAAYTYSWQPGGQTSQSVSGLSGGTYTVVAKDANGCSINKLISIANPATPPITASVNSTTICSTNNVTITPSGAISYTIVPSVGAAITTSSNAVFTPTTSTSYDVYGINSASCISNTVSLNVLVNPTPTVSLSSSNPMLCSGNSITVTPFGASTYTLTNGSVSYSTLPFSFVPSASSTYTLIGKASNNCISDRTTTLSITVDPSPTIAIGSVSSPTICSGLTTTITPSGASTYTLSSGSVLNTSFPFVVSPTVTTTYTITGKSPAGCVAVNTSTVTIYVGPGSVISYSTASSPTICSGQSATITPGGATSYTLTNGTNVYTTPPFVVNPTTTTNYTLSGNNSSSCQAINTPIATIYVNQTPTVSISSVVTPTICNGSSSTITPGGANSYTLTNGINTYTSMPFVLSPSVTTTYTLTGKSSNNCSAANSSTVSVFVNPTPTVSLLSISSQTLCSGNSATISPTGANTYTLNDGVSYKTTTPFVVSPSVSTTYSISGTSSANCLSTSPVIFSITVNQTPTVTLNSSSTSICIGNTSTITANGANTYTLSNGSTTYTSNAQFVLSPTGTTTYSITGTSSQLCPASNTAIATVTVNSLPTLTLTPTDVLCYGLSTGSVGVLYSPASVTVTGNPFTNLAAGNYTYFATNLVTGCVNSNTVSISQPSSPLSSFPFVVNGNTDCVLANGIASVNISGGTPSYSVSWSNGYVGMSPNNMNTGVHSYTVTDSHGCSVTSGTLQMIGVNGVIATAITQQSVACYGLNTGAATYTTSGSGPFTYTLSNGSTNTVNSTGVYTGLAAGAYTLFVTGSGGCTDQQLLNVPQPVIQLNAIAVASSSAQCYGGTGTASVVVIGGTPGYSYSWQSSSANSNTVSLTAGTYTVQVKDANNCIASSGVTISQPPIPLTTHAVVSNNTDCVIANGGAEIFPNGGTTPYTYHWFNNAATSTVGSLGPGTYSFSVTDANNCTTTGTVTIINSNAPIINTIDVKNVNCHGYSTGSAISTVSSGTSPYTYSWSAGAAATNTVTGLAAGVYTLTVEDAGKCLTEKTFTVTEATAISVQTLSIAKPCPDQNNGSAVIRIQGGNPSYNVSLVNNAFVSTDSILNIPNLESGEHVITVSDFRNCKITYTIDVVVSDDPNCDNLLIPQVFTPNGDGKNDRFEIKGIVNFPNNNIVIFNRWGDQVYKAEPYKNDWDGINKGDKSILGSGQLPASTYYYIFDKGDGSKPVTGYVQLTR